MELFLSRLCMAKTLFDIITLSYERVNAEREKEFYRRFNEAVIRDREYFNQIRRLIELLIDNDISIYIFYKQLLSIIQVNRYNIEIVCCALIYYSDLIFELNTNKPASFNIIMPIGPMNDPSFPVLVYPKSCKSLISFADSTLNFRKRLNYNTNSINTDLSKFILVRKNILGNVIPTIQKYLDEYINEEKILKDKEIKIAIVPFTCDELLKISFESPSFNIAGPKPGMDIEIQRRYLHIINQLISDGINIAVFPELSLTQDALKEIKKLLNVWNTPLRLIVCGSIWENNSNVLYLLSYNGEEILRIEKSSPFRCIDENGNTCDEDLRNCSNELCLIDLEGIGRIYISICFDYLNSSRTLYPSILESNTSIISSYSPSESRFREKVKSQGENLNISIFCNCCTPRIKFMNKKSSIEVGFLSLPGINGSDVENTFFHYEACNECFPTCKEKACYTKYTLYPEKIIKYDDITTIKCEQEQVWIEL